MFSSRYRCYGFGNFRNRNTGTMSMTLSRRPPRRFWGWGLAGDRLAERERAAVQAMLGRLGAALEDRPAPQVTEFDLAAARVTPPAALAAQFSCTPLDRLNHSAGKSYADCARMWLREASSPPDWVAYPDDEQAIVDILDWAQTGNVAVIPYGGGSSVCGGVEAAVGSGHAGAVSLDLERLGRVIEIDPISRAARIQAGALGPELETQLKPHGLTLRHFPQSFEFSTLGGWIATRAGGHYATHYTHIDDFVEATRLVTPAGIMQTRRLPASGAGPAPDRLVIGSEGHARRHRRGVDAAAGRAAVSRLGVGAIQRLRSRRRVRAGHRAVRAQPQQLPAARSAGGRILGRRRRAFGHPRARIRIVRPSAAGLDGARPRTRDRPWRAIRRRCRRAFDVQRTRGRTSQRRGRRLARRVHSHAVLARRGRRPRSHHGHV
jgi:hypothetical protein